MADKKIIEKLADVPLAQPGFDALSLAAPLIIHGNPQGKWQVRQPDSLDEGRLRAIVQHLVTTKVITSDASYCHQCALENKNAGINSNYVPVMMMPLYTSAYCPFDMESQIKEDSKPKKKAAAKEDHKHKAETSKPRK